MQYVIGAVYFMIDHMHSVSSAVKWVPWSDAMIRRVLCQMLELSVSHQIVVLTESLWAGEREHYAWNMYSSQSIQVTFPAGKKGSM